MKKQYPNKTIRGILVGSSITSTFEKEMLEAKNIDTYLYGWKFSVYKPNQ
ncbi:hypothetical protein [Halobacillus shinanisalinarum]